VIILGIDPGSIRTGYGILNTTNDILAVLDYGLIQTNPKHSFPLRLKAIYDNIILLIEKYSPESAAVEDTFYAKNVKSALKLAQVKGVALLAAVQKGLKVTEYSPLDIKKAVAGYGLAEKNQIREMVQRILKIPLEGKAFDTSDALAIAICHAHSVRFSTLTET
jgi:crossover junction endodeoxyribonuclease RuvC